MKKYLLIGLLCILIILSKIYLNTNGYEFNDLQGTLIWPLSYGHNPTQIYGVNLNESLSEPNIYYSNDNYNIYYPFNAGSSMVYVSIHENGENEIIQVNNGNITSLLKKDDEILFPHKIKDNKIIYLGIDKYEQAYIGEFLIDKNLDNTLKKDNINTKSKLSVSGNGSILFVTKKEDKYYINIIDSAGNCKEIISGRYPVWLDDEKTFIYYSGERIRLYDLVSNKSKVIEKNSFMVATPVISPDKKFMAIFESGASAPFGGVTVDFLRIMPINGGKKIDVYAFNKPRNFGGLEWID